MRKSIWTAAIALGLGLAGTASAQTITGYTGSATPTGGANQVTASSPGINLSTYLSNAFDLTQIFAPFQFFAKVQTPGVSVIPSSNSPLFLQCFGYQKLY